MTAAKVLVVDDEVEFAEAIAERLRNRGYDVDTVNSGTGALAKIKERAYDAVLLDMAMPEMDGMETMKRMLEQEAGLQVIILTGYGSVERGVEAIKHGAADFVEKPADIETLVGKVDTAQEKREAIFEKDLEKKVADVTKRRPW